MILIVGFFLTNAGCATTVVRPPTVAAIEVRAIEQDVVAKRYAKYYEQKRWYDSISSALARSNGPNCPTRLLRWRIGITALSDRQYRRNPNNIIRFIPSVLGTTVQSVVPGAQADGKLAPGDVILNWDGTGDLPVALELYRPPPGEYPLALVAPPSDTLSLVVRAGVQCPTVLFVMSDEATALTDGNEYYITTALAEHVQNADEAALIMAHELAHMISDHVRKMRHNALLGGVLGALLDAASCAASGICNSTTGTVGGLSAGSVAFSQDFEDEADYLAVLLSIRAGFDAEKAADFWLRMAEQTGLGYSSTHPAHVGRYANTVARARAIAACAETLGGPLFLLLPDGYFSREEQIRRRNAGVEGTCMHEMR